MYHSLPFVALLAGLSHSLPTLQPRGFQGSTEQVSSSVQKNWYHELATPSSGSTTNAQAQAYTCFGPQMSQFPSMDKWKSFEDLWAINTAQITAKNNGNQQYVSYIQQAIRDISSSSKVDARLILSIIMQESTGGVSIQCTNDAGTDCGLMQHRGGSQFDSSKALESIENMIKDGLYGVPGFPGYLQLLNGDPAVAYVDKNNVGGWQGNPYAAAFIYNVGHLDSLDLTKAVDEHGKTVDVVYARDIAARLTGWDGLARGQC